MALLRIENKQGIVTIFLNRPEKRNAMSFALLHELIHAAHQIKKDRNVRCVILTGEAQVFSAGIDLADLNSPKNTAYACLLYTSPSPRDATLSRMPSSA